MSNTVAVDRFRYARLGSHLVCVDQPLDESVRTLLSARRRAGLASLGVSAREALRDLLCVLRSRLRFADDYPALPAFGHVGIPVHRGYKLFDLANQTVTKVFSPETPEGEARAEIEVCRSVSAVRAAPGFIAADPSGRWYTEEFIVGVHGAETERARSGSFMAFADDVRQCLLELAAIEEPLVVDAGEHIRNLADDRYLEPWVAAGVDDDAVTDVRIFRDELAEWLFRELSSAELTLVPGHGDFGLVNVIVADGEFRVIDWEGTRHGSLLSDCFNFVFVERYYGRAKGDVIAEMRTIADEYTETIRRKRPDLSQAAELPRPVAVRLYYLERLRLLLERDISRNLAGVLQKSVAMFREFDRNAAYPPLAG